MPKSKVSLQPYVKNKKQTGKNPACHTILTGLPSGGIQFYRLFNYSAMRISSILIAESGMRVPGPKIAATPAL